MDIKVFSDPGGLASNAASHVASIVKESIGTKGKARIVAATGVSQIDFLNCLVTEPDIDWSAVELFHLDEYIGLPESHPASFRKYLYERLVSRAGIQAFHALAGDAADPEEVCRSVGQILNQAPVDVAIVGIGENAHLAFNDPPADFETVEPYIIVTLDAACRRQQLNEGWFPTLESVPEKAISMSVQQILSADRIVCIAPEKRKAVAIRNSFEEPISSDYPASALRMHPEATIYLDLQSSHLLTKTVSD